MWIDLFTDITNIDFLTIGQIRIHTEFKFIVLFIDIKVAARSALYLQNNIYMNKVPIL